MTENAPYDALYAEKGRPIFYGRRFGKIVCSNRFKKYCKITVADGEKIVGVGAVTNI